VVARLKAHLPEWLTAAQKRFGHEPPQQIFCPEQARVEIWDANDFDSGVAPGWGTIIVSTP
jgi:hypothetical protein